LSPGRGNPLQVGLARLITDNVTFAYLTDVYILDEYQGKGLGKWLIGCVNEVLSTWPELRRMMLIRSGDPKFYEETLGMKNFVEGENGLFIMNRKGPGSVC
jgi:GNAT superfamily N-acetyltransferase